MADRLILVRHASPGADCAGRFIGSSDPPLDTAGRLQARTLAPFVMRLDPGHCYCSPRSVAARRPRRCWPTCPWKIDDDLRGDRFRPLENRRFEEISAAEPERSGRLGGLHPTLSFPAASVWPVFFERVSGGGRPPGGGEDVDTVLAVTHGGVIRAMICHLLSLERRHYVLFNVDYAAVVVIRLFDGRGVLVFQAATFRAAIPAEVRAMAEIILVVGRLPQREKQLCPRTGRIAIPKSRLRGHLPRVRRRVCRSAWASVGRPGRDRGWETIEELRDLAGVFRRHGQRSGAAGRLRYPCGSTTSCTPPKRRAAGLDEAEVARLWRGDARRGRTPATAPSSL